MAFQNPNQYTVSHSRSIKQLDFLFHHSKHLSDCWLVCMLRTFIDLTAINPASTSLTNYWHSFWTLFSSSRTHGPNLDPIVCVWELWEEKKVTKKRQNQTLCYARQWPLVVNLVASLFDSMYEQPHLSATHFGGHIPTSAPVWCTSVPEEQNELARTVHCSLFILMLCLSACDN